MKSQHWVIVIIIIITGYYVLSFIFDDYSEREWKPNDSKLIIKRCMEESGEMATKYPELNYEYCECSIEAIQKRLDRKQYLEVLEKNIQEQQRTLGPIFKKCLEDYRRKIKEGIL